MHIRHILAATILSGTILASTAPAPVLAQEAPDGSAIVSQEDAIRATIEDYFWGRQNAEQDRLERAFDEENGRFAYVVRNAEGDMVNSMSLGEFAERATRPISYPNTGRILALDIINDEMAMVKFEIASETRTFTDLFLLYRVNGHWTILFKTASMEMHPAAD